jgi:hypothetical protein
MQTIYLTALIQQLSAVVDHGHKVPIGETKKHIQQGDVPRWLKEKFGIDLFHPAEAQEFTGQLHELLGGVSSLASVITVSVC